MQLETDPRSELVKLVLENSEATGMMLRRRMSPLLGCSVVLFGTTEQQAKRVADSIDKKLKVISSDKGGWFIYVQEQYTCPSLILSIAKNLPPFSFDWDAGVKIEIRD